MNGNIALCQFALKRNSAKMIYNSQFFVRVFAKYSERAVEVG